MERVVNKENDLEHNVEGYSADGPVVGVGGEEMVTLMN